MGPLSNIAAGLSLATLALSSPTSASLRTNTKACGQIVPSMAQGNVTENHYPTVSAKLAYDCLMSVPFNQSAALLLVDGLAPYLKWQSNLVWIKDPPQTYIDNLQQPHDVLGGLDKIRSKVVAKSYKNEYEFGSELYLNFQNAHDSNLQYTPDVLGTVFKFSRPVSLVSVSSDGKALPEPYVYSDVLADAQGANFKPSRITHINDEDAKTYLTKLSQLGNFQDPDALYNSMFYQLAGASTGIDQGLGAFADANWVYPGPTTSLKFANGTTRTYDNFAKVLVPFTNITDGSSLYKYWFNCENRLSQLHAPTIWGPFAASGFPNPVVRQKDNAVGGYYLKGDHSDTAVLSMPTFGNIYTQPDVQKTVVKFLAQAKADGKKKLIIDFQNNNDRNGDVLLAYDLYELLFPKNKDQPLLQRYRAFESTILLNNATSNAAHNFPRVATSDDAVTQTLNTYIFSTSLDYQTDVDANGKPFPNWQARIGPGAKQKGDEFTNLFRLNFDDVLLGARISNTAVKVHGYGPLANWKGTQPFAAEDIAVVTDGTCGAACAIASEMLRQRQNIKFLTVGGRPRPGPMQHIGSSRGALNWNIGYIQQYVEYMVSGGDNTVALNATELNQYWATMPMDRVALNTNATINFHDSLRDGDEAQVPLQFWYETSDCRILLTKKMTVDISSLWTAVADSAFGKQSHCIAGKIN